MPRFLDVPATARLIARTGVTSALAASAPAPITAAAA